MSTKELLIVCGISGAGKTIAMDYFECAGYYCIDNLPSEMIGGTLKILNEKEYYQHYAIAINSNIDANKMLDLIVSLRSYEWLTLKILYLDVDNETLQRRFQLTRKQHPFINQYDTLFESIDRERDNLMIMRNKADLVIDTSKLRAKQLKNYLGKVIDQKLDAPFRLCFVSYGYKHGIPQDLDYAFDVRFIENPYYNEELKNLDGNNDLVYDFVLSQSNTKDLLTYLLPLLKYCIKNQQATNRSYLVIGIGCTGGKHRSVSLVNYLYNYFNEDYQVIKEHRDLEK
ncbi:MAG: RNase adapter RapZ [Bacilli bacterium]|jgi:UPF0042 nucleotide-binding protein|nr:RNase adapter RapZ [Bacilli bacterium]